MIIFSHYNHKLKLGIGLIILSFILGYGGPAICAWLFYQSENTVWVSIGTGLYIFSWILFGIAFILSGEEAYNCVKDKLKAGKRN